jgi:cysteine-rich repeat protein
MMMMTPDYIHGLRGLHSLCLQSARGLGLILTALLIATHARAASLPAGFIETTVGGSWNEAVGMEFSADGRLFVWERGGRIWTVDGGVKSGAPFLDIAEEVGGWRDFGLLGVALHPDYLNNGYIYLYYVVDQHHLLNAGTGAYNPGTNTYFAATQGRITRYQAIKGAPSDPDYSNATGVDYGSRFVLHGDAVGTGCPILYESHGTGHLVFGEDNTLLAACGDGASYSTTDPGNIGHTYYADAIALGIMRPEENVGAYRSQMLSSLSGKILRLDPATGLGLSSNPHFDGDPSTTRSKVFALGLRNPYRMVRKPGTGDHDPAVGDPGIIYIGDVGWGTWEDLHVMNGPGQNFGWPAFEGLEVHNGYWSSSPENPDAPNPLYDGTTCTQEFFEFTDLLQQATLDPAADFPNPCDVGQDVPGTTPTFFHTRPKIDMRHGATGGARWGSFDGFDAITVDVGAAMDPMGKSVPGPLFGSNTSTAGVFYTGTQFPVEYQGQYLHAEWDHGWIKRFDMDANDDPVQIVDFANGAGGVVFVSMDPTNGDLYYISWTALVYKVQYIGEGNAPPNAVATAAPTYGPGPLSVNFTGDGSTDPEALPLTYLWELDGPGVTSTLANPAHIYAGTPGVPEKKTITLTVTDDGNGDPDEQDSTTVDIWINNTPPLVSITNPVDDSLYSVTSPTIYNLTASYSDAESVTPTLTCEWLVALHHNDHFHSDPPITDCVGASTEIAPIGCDPNNTFWWRIHLTVTDEQGLSTHEQINIYPDVSGCPNEVPFAITDSSLAARGLVTTIDVLANDFDNDGTLDPSSVTIITPPSEGSIDSINGATGEVSYLADPDALLNDSFTYTVDDNDGDPSNVATVNITTFNTPPTATLTSPLDGTSFSEGQSISLTGTVDDAEDVPSLIQDWSIDRIHNGVLTPDVYTHSGATPPNFVVPAFGAPGDHVSYLVSLLVTDIAGDQASDSAALYPAVSPPGSPPAVALIANPTSGGQPLLVDFDASGTTDADGDLLTYSWDFGDGQSLTSGAVLQHTYTGNSVYLATVTVTDSIGMQNSAAAVITTDLGGVTGEYFDNQTLIEPPVLTRVDPFIDFDWGNGSPDPSIPDNSYSARWTGQIVPDFSESYTFYISIDDGGRLWIDDILVIDSWVDQAETEYPSSPIALTAGVPVDFKFEYYENGGGAKARLRWSSASQAKEIIPAGNLQGPPAPDAPPVAVYDVATYPLGGGVLIDILANDLDDGPALDPASVLTGPALHGSLSLNPGTGAVTYTHDGSPTTTDWFTYSVEDTSNNVSNTVAVILAIDEVCGDGVVSGAESCDDGNVADGDCCSSACAFEALGSACDDADACTELDTCDGAGICIAGAPPICDDGLFCNGTESCDSGLGCQAGTPPVVDDGILCTIDACDEGGDTVTHLPNHGLCANLDFCDGDETCDVLLGCQAGVPPSVDDGVTCTDDSCDEGTDSIVHVPNDSLCDNGDFCDGDETCDVLLDCQVGTPPVVDDGVLCTDDSCDEGTDSIVNAPNDALCADGSYCNGYEICDVLSDCGPGTPPNIDDGVACTDDSCDEIGQQVVNAPNDSLCDDLDPCTADSCDAVTGCGHDPIPECQPQIPMTGPNGTITLALLILLAGSLMLAVENRRQRSTAAVWSHPRADR